jgi:pyridoxal phosphate enzyme (YggS family)
MTALKTLIEQNLSQVRERIQRAAERAKRDPAEVTLIAVTKSAPDDAISLLGDLGVHDLGESRPQQLVQRVSLVPTGRWHLIGHLQRNKVKSVLPHVVMIHSVDSLRLLTAIGEAAGQVSLKPRVLLEVNVAGEAQKDGFAIADVRSHWAELMAVPHVRIGGLMTMAPLSDDPEASRPVFRRLRELRDELQDTAAAREADVTLPELSMGMSGDFEVGIEEGATMVRVGSAIFGE